MRRGNLLKMWPSAQLLQWPISAPGACLGLTLFSSTRLRPERGKKQWLSTIYEWASSPIEHKASLCRARPVLHFCILKAAVSAGVVASCSMAANWAFNATAVCCRQYRASTCGALTSVLGPKDDFTNIFRCDLCSNASIVYLCYVFRCSAIVGRHFNLKIIRPTGASCS